MQGQAKDVTVNAAQLGSISFTAAAVTGSNIFPGWDSKDQTVTITATKGNGTFEYECNLVVSSNTAAAEGVDGATAFTDLYVTATAGTGATVETGLTQGDGVKIEATEAPQTIKLATGSIDANGTTLIHNFTYKLTFKDTNKSQNEQQGANIAATVSCKLSGEEDGQHFTEQSH